MQPRAHAGRGVVPTALSIAGSDSGAGAGIQADLKTFAAHGVYGTSAITAVTAQNTLGVQAVAEMSPELVRAQIDAVLEDLGADAVKIGMLGTAAVVHEVASALERWRPPVVVLDPVMVAESGDPLIHDDAVAAVAQRLLPLATLVTPNLPEAQRLCGLPVAQAEQRLRAAQHLAAAGTAVLIKGGHDRAPEVEDLLVVGGEVHRYVHPRLQSSCTHGTGCTLSAAVAARMAGGDDLVQAVGGAIDYLHGAIASASPLGSGRGPVHHFYRGCAARAVS